MGAGQPARAPVSSILPAVHDPRAMLERLLGLPSDQRSAELDRLAPDAERWRPTYSDLTRGPDPDAALRWALSLPPALFDAPPPRALVELLHQGSYPARLMRLIEPARCLALLADPGPPVPDYASELNEAIGRHGPAEGLARVRTRAYLDLARRELEHAPLEEVGGPLSDLSGACLDAALRSVDPGLLERVCVFGMGKLGGRELNFLSDIDLIFVHDDTAISEQEEGRSHRERARLFSDLRKVLKLLEGSGAWRPLFHVDLRLRPFGSRGPLSISASGLERYYERHGRGWERQAWLRARPIAGNLELGGSVLRRLEPFIWPRSLGPEVFAEVGEMMKRSRAQARRGLGPAAIDLKHDPGGIREVEFFVQSLQLLNGGRHVELRAHSTLGALDRLAAAGFVSDREHEVLSGAYRVLRRIEHRVQLGEGQQTHKLPADPQQRACLARRLAVHAPETWLEPDRRGAPRPRPETGDSDRGSPLRDLDLGIAELRARVQAISCTLTGESDLADAQTDTTAVAKAVIIDPASSARSRAEALASLGLWPEAAEEAAATLDHLLSRPGGPLTASGPARVGAQRLLLACLDSADPVAALRRLVEFSANRPAHYGVWRLMAAPERDPMVRQVADLFGASEPLSRGLIGLPLATADEHSGRDGGLALLLEATTKLSLADAEELWSRFLDDQSRTRAPLHDRLLRFKHRELVRLGLFDLGRRPDPLAVGRTLSDLADLVVRILLVDLAQTLPAGEPPFHLAVLAAGKFGMQAMDYGSDLDLMFVFEPSTAISPTLVRDAAQKVSRRLIATLESRAGGPRLYEVDMRLRPSGRQGLLVSSMAGFRRYHERKIEIWERLALVRLRPIAEVLVHTGPADPPTPLTAESALPARLCAAITTEVVPRSLWPSQDDDPDAILRATWQLKRRIEAEVARETRDQIDVKAGRGGCLELELLVSALQLCHGKEAGGSPDLRSREIPLALRGLAEHGVLGASEARDLERAYRFQRLLLNRLRMTRVGGWGENDRLPLNSPRLAALARRMGLADRDALIATLAHERDVVRLSFDRHLRTDRTDNTHAGDH